MKIRIYIVALSLALCLPRAGAQTIFLTDFEGRPAGARIETSGNGTTRIQLDLFLENTIADIRGVFFDLETRFQGFSIQGPQVTSWYSDNFATDQTGIAAGNLAAFGPVSRDVNLNGTGSVFDLSVEFGTAGVGGDDIRAAFLVLTNDTAMDIGPDFGMRLMSVGLGRDESRKLLGGQSNPVPEPGTMILFGMGLLALGHAGRRLTKSPVNR